MSKKVRSNDDILFSDEPPVEAYDPVTGEVDYDPPYRAPKYDFYLPRDAAVIHATTVMPGGPSLTRQEFSDDADINVIMQRYEKTGVLPLPGVAPQYMDLTGAPVDYQTAMNQLIEAERAFMTLPAKTRLEFNNSPLAFVEFAENPENLEQMRTWGLAPPAKLPDPPQKVEIVNPPAAGDSKPA